VQRAAADIVWEDADRPPQTLFFESPVSSRGLELTASPHAFLTAAAPPALARRERRIAVDGAVSPRLRDGLLVALRTLVRWSRPDRTVPLLEPRSTAPTRPARGARAGLLFSGGVDSMALLHANRRDFPPDHPRAFTTAIFVDGFDINLPGAADEGAYYDLAFDRLRVATEDVGVRLVRVRTNVRELGSLWPQEHQGAAAAGLAHACARVLGRVETASSYTWDTLFPYGTHPALDLHYSSADLRVVHADLNRTRLEKLGAMADWPAGLSALRTCWEGDRQQLRLNCGTCHKCVLTMLELVAVGRLGACTAFPDDDVTPAMAERLKAHQLTSIPFFTELVPALQAAGRPELAAIVSRKVEQIRAGLPGGRPSRLRRLLGRVGL